MGRHILAGNPPVEITLRRSARARRISLRVSSLDGRVTLTLPRGVPEREAMDFARSREDWLRGHLARQAPQVVIAPGAVLPVEGRAREVVAATGRHVLLRPDRVEVPGPPAQAAARLRGWLRARARDRLAGASDLYAARLGRGYSGITLRDTRSRWGSCSSAGRLNYSWRLILAPPEVLDYVAAHEVAHLEEMNHSAAFWAVVERLHGPWQAPRDWLREQGHDLHRYRFED